MKALVTGSNGFIGSHLVERLIEKKYQVRCLVRKTSDLRWIKDLPVEFVFGDVTDYQSLMPVVKDINFVFHLGGIVRARTFSEYQKVNHEGTKNLLEACKQFSQNFNRFVYISSQAVVGPSKDGDPINEDYVPRPISNYGRTKLAGEHVVKEYQPHFPFTIIRPPSVYGPRDDDIYQLFKIIKWGVKPIVGKKHKKLSIIYITDLVNGIIRAAEHPRAANEIFFLTNEQSYSWEQLENTIANAIGKRGFFVYIPPVVIDLIAAINEFFGKMVGKAVVLNADKAREMKQQNWVVSGEKAKERLKFSPDVEIETGIRKTHDWYCQQGWL